MSNRPNYFFFKTTIVVIALSAVPLVASAGFRTADLSYMQSRTDSTMSNLYKVRDRYTRGDRRHKRYKHYRHSRRGRHSDRRIFFYPPYYPLYSPIWLYPPYYNNYYDPYYRRPRSGITFYFSN